MSQVYIQLRIYIFCLEVYTLTLKRKLGIKIEKIDVAKAEGAEQNEWVTTSTRTIISWSRRWTGKTTWELKWDGCQRLVIGQPLASQTKGVSQSKSDRNSNSITNLDVPVKKTGQHSRSRKQKNWVRELLN